MNETLEKLIEAYLPKATAGDPDAAEVVLRAVALQARIQGL